MIEPWIWESGVLAAGPAGKPPIAPVWPLSPVKLSCSGARLTAVSKTPGPLHRAVLGPSHCSQSSVPPLPSEDIPPGFCGPGIWFQQELGSKLIAAFHEPCYLVAASEPQAPNPKGDLLREAASLRSPAAPVRQDAHACSAPSI